EVSQKIFGQHVSQDDGRERPDQQHPKHDTHPTALLAGTDLSMTDNVGLCRCGLGSVNDRIMCHFRHDRGLVWWRCTQRPMMAPGIFPLGDNTMRSLTGAILL